MKLTFLGVGEAFDPQLSNCSYLIESETNLLVDCGFAALPNLLNAYYNPNLIDAVYITHFHADHTFGLPALLVRTIMEESRRKPLKLISQPGLKEFIPKLLTLAYPGIAEKVIPMLELVETNGSYKLNELSLTFAESAHSLKNNAICISNGKSTLGISGDGALTEATRELYQSCDVLVHEAFRLNVQMHGHESGKIVAEYASSLEKLKTLALVHIQRDERAVKAEDFKALSEVSNCQVILPQPGDVLEL